MRKTKEYYKRANYILSRTLDKMNDRCSDHLCNTEFSRQGYKRGSYRFIPITTISVIDQLITAHKHLAKTYALNFLDAGCGIGNVMLLASSVGFWQVHGLELDPEVIKFAKTVNPMYTMYNSIEEQDIMTYTDYKRFDVIYYYCPFSNVEKQVKFEERVENQMKVGALLIANLKRSYKILKDKRFRKINSSMWEKIAK